MSRRWRLGTARLWVSPGKGAAEMDKDLKKVAYYPGCALEGTGYA